MTKEKKSKAQVKYLTEQQVHDLMDVVSGMENKLIIKLLLDTGMRINEFSLIKHEHINFIDSYIRIPAENTKTATERTVRVNRELMNDLRDFCEMRHIKQGFIWQHKGSNYPRTTRAFQLMIKSFGMKAGIPWLTPHKFRHTHAVHATQKGVPMPAIQGQLGHASITTTQMYTKLAPKQIQEAYDHAGL